VTLAHLVALTLVILITPTRIGQWFNAFGIKLRGMGVGGMFLLGLMVGTSICSQCFFRHLSMLSTRACPIFPVTLTRAQCYHRIPP
jgi:hypothetical protein